jgi:Cu+-exporting ATPase
MSTAHIADAGENPNSNIDPVCGMTVSPDTKLRHVHEGKTYLFCNPKCLAKFQATPEKYLNPQPTQSAQRCDVRLPDGPGSSPAWAGQLSEVRHGAGAGIPGCGCG